MSASPYMIAQYSIFWVFPDAAERNAYDAISSDRYKIAYQESDDSHWMLKTVNPDIWIPVGSGGGGVLGQIPLYNSAGSYTPVDLVNTNEVPFYLSNGTQSNISLV